MTALATAVVAGLLAVIAAQQPSATGQVLFSGLPVPGATITATQADRTVAVTSGENGEFSFAGLEAGSWMLRVEMRGFAGVSREMTVPLTDALTLRLTMLPYADIVRTELAGATPPADAAMPPAAVAEPPLDAADVISGSVTNGGATPFALPAAFGNNRPRRPSAYNGTVTTVLSNSAWNARPFAFGRADAPAPAYGDLQVGFTLGGPLRIPRLVPSGSQMFIAYQRGIVNTATTRSARMPTAAERAGDFSQSGVTVRDPFTGVPFAASTISPDRISPQAASLLAYYPLPNMSAAGGANYQTPIVAAARQDNLQLALTKSNARANFTGALTYQRTVTDSTSLFDFEDEIDQSTLSATVAWARRVSPRLTVRTRYQLTRTGTTVTPFFAHRTNVSGHAGILGNNQDPANWGPPALIFPGIAGLADADPQRAIRLTHGAGGEVLVRRGLHTLVIGGDLRWNRVDVLSDLDPRGTLTFTGAASGHAFADFLLGIPAASAIASGNPSTRLRARAYDAYFIDDWRMHPNLTLNLGVRWEHEAPFTESSGHLVNLDAAPRFSAVSPVLATRPRGSLTGLSYPASLIRSDKRGLQPRLGLSWRPVLSSSLLIRAGYGVYRNLGAYESLALLLAQQPPFSNTFSIQNDLTRPFTLTRPFPLSSGASNTVAVDPNLRSAAAHNWQVSVQRELPASLTATVAYLGTRGTHLLQAFLPNTYPAGAPNPCPMCPAGFVYVTSTGSSLRNAAQFTLRRRLQNGLTASVQYTLAMSTDDAATFNDKNISLRALSVAQDWLHLDAERGPSSFDQRHLVAAEFEYTTGVGVAGGTLDDGLRGALFKDWTIKTQLTTGTGLPLTPIAFVGVAGTGVVGVRAARTGMSPEPVAAGSYANAAAFTTPATGTWGDAGRHSIRGPARFSLDLSIARVLRLRGRMTLEGRVAATNVLNRVTFAAIDTVITSPQFGQPVEANAMRRLQITSRLGF